MSRAAVTKSRADKGKPPASQTPVIAHEIVPGKFNEHDWYLMLDHDSSEDFVIDMIEEVVDHAMVTIYDNYIESQLLPFTITQAKDAILQIIEWQFLSRDEGELEAITDPGWLPDEEPDPAMTDCWAQGAVPKSYLAPPVEAIPEEPEFQDVVEEKSSEEILIGEEEEPELEDKVSDTEEAEPEPEPEEQEEEMTSETKLEDVKERRRRKFKPYRGKLKSANVKNMTESLEETEMKLYMQIIADAMRPSVENISVRQKMPASCQSLLKETVSEPVSQVQAGRPPGSKEVEYDEMGNVVSVVKLDPEKLPNHRVKVKYHVIDPSVELAQGRLEAMRHGKFISSETAKPTRTNLRKSAVSSEASSSARLSKTTKSFHQPTMTSLPPPLIEAMEISPGVIVKEGNRVKKGPGRYFQRVDVLDDHQNKLRPVTSKIQTSTIDVADLLECHTPILRPIQETPPLPPIVPHPPLQPRVS